MIIPFTREEFFEVFKNYNVAVFPMQFILYLMAIFAIYAALKKRPFSDKIISFILFFLWLWMGIIYHLTFFTAINKAAYFFGFIFIFQGLLFLYSGFFKKKFSFNCQRNISGLSGGLLIIFALVVYPLIGYFLGHVYPSSPTFGLPCPTTIFTFGLLLWTDRKYPAYILIIPVAWSVIGYAAAVTLRVREDFGLLFSGLIALSFYYFSRTK